MEKRMLEKLKKMFDDEAIAALIRDKDEEVPVDILTVLLPEFGANMKEAYGEFFFSFVPEELKGDFISYNSMVTVSDEINVERKNELLEAMAMINFYLESGAFGVNAEGTQLVYKATATIPATLDEEAVYECVRVNTIRAISIADTFCDLLLNIMTGAMELEDIVKSFLTPLTEED